MDYKEKMCYVATVDRCWTDIRENKNTIVNFISGGKSLEQRDFVLLFQCLTLILAQMDLYKDDYTDISKEELEEISSANSNVGEMILEISKKISYWTIIIDKNVSLEKRLETIDKLRKDIWRNLIVKKHNIERILIKYPILNNLKDIALLFACVSLILLELDLKDEEIKILEGE